MAACSDTEEKPSSPKETLPLTINLENAVNHEMRKNCYNEFNNISKNHETYAEITEKLNTKDVSTLSEDEFRELMIEASTFNKSSKQESALLKKLRKDNPVTDIEPSDKLKLFKNCSSQFSVHRNSKSIGTNSASLCSYNSRTSDSRKKHCRNRDESKNFLHKGIHQSQSLQDLMSSDFSKSKQKPHKAHRTHSLSSDEVLGIETESMIFPRTTKKSSRTSFSKTDAATKCLTTLPGSISVTVEVDSSVPCGSVSDKGLSPQSLSNNCNSGGTNFKELTTSPIEIEMEEIKPEKGFEKDTVSSAVKDVESIKNSPQGNSKFYVDCNDIDATVTFPLKLVSSMDDQNTEAINDLKRIPLVPWPRPLQVQSFFNEKQMLSSTDINGNPFSSRNSRNSNIASFVTTALTDYSNGGVASEGKNRKNKRLRNAGNKPVLSEEIAGHRGLEDIDTLLQFINSSDKKGKAPGKSSTTNQVLGKNNLLHDNDKKKTFSKDMKSCNKNVINGIKKKLTRSNSLENISSRSTDASDVFTFESRASVADMPISARVSNFENYRSLDINSNDEVKFSENDRGKDSSTDDSSLHNSVGHSSPDVSSFAADFYSTADVSSQTQAVEESGFLIVKKKQRKKHQGKRLDSYRWRNSQTQRKKGIMLPLADSKCGKQDSRRKSTSSVPHSEHSSADNSDLDSVHSLPVRGSVPHPTQPHPHTTPSSTSSTPQASYADIARMPISKLNSPSPCNINSGAQAALKQSVQESEIKKLDTVVLGGEAAKRSMASEHELTSNFKTLPHNVSTDEEIDCSSVPVKVRSLAKSTREINTQTEPENVAIDISKVDSTVIKVGKKIAEELPKTGCPTCSFKKSTCSCPKPIRQKAKSVDIPPVIMDNMPLESDACNVSFGFGVDEVLNLAPVKCDTSTIDFCQKDNLVVCDKTASDSSDSKNVGGCDGISEISSVYSKTLNTSQKNSSTSDAISKTVHDLDLSNEQSSHRKPITLRSGKVVIYSESKVNVEHFNHRELVNFFGKEFPEVKDAKGTSKNDNSSKVKYYVDSSEEA